MAMLAIGLPTVADCGRRVMLMPDSFQFVADRGGARVEFTVGEPDVQPGDQERRDELAEAESRPTLMLPKTLVAMKSCANAPSRT